MSWLIIVFVILIVFQCTRHFLNKELDKCHYEYIGVEISMNISCPTNIESHCGLNQNYASGVKLHRLQKVPVPEEGHGFYSFLIRGIVDGRSVCR